MTSSPSVNPFGALFTSSCSREEGFKVIREHVGDINVDLINTLRLSVAKSLKTNDYDRAIFKTEWLVEIFHILKKDKDAATCTEFIGRIQEQSMNLDKAILYYHEAMKYRIPKRDFKIIAELFSRIIICHDKKKDFEGVISTCNTALKLSTKLGYEKIGIVGIYPHLINALKRLGKLKDVKDLEKKYLETKKIVDVIDSNIPQFDKATSLSMIGKTNQAMELFEKIKLIFTVDSDPQQKAVYYLNAGGNLSDGAFYDEATDYSIKSTDFYRSCGDKDGEARARRNLASNYEDTGLFQVALDEYRAVLRLFEEQENWISVGTTLNDLGVTSKNLNLFMDAIRYYLAAKEIFERENDIKNLADVIANLDTIFTRIRLQLSDEISAEAYYLFKMGNFKKMAEVIESGIPSIKTYPRPTTPTFGTPSDVVHLFDKAVDLLYRGEIKRSVPEMWAVGTTYQVGYNNYPRAIQMYYNTGKICDANGRYHDLIRLSRDLGICYEQAGLFDEARDILQELIDIADSKKIYHVLWEAYYHLAKMHWKQNRFALAENCFSRAIDLVEQNALTFKHIRTAEGYLIGKISLYQSYVDFLIERGEKNHAYEIVLKAKSWPFVTHVTSIRRSKQVPLIQDLSISNTGHISVIEKIIQEGLNPPDETNRAWIRECEEFHIISEACEISWNLNANTHKKSISISSVQERILPGCILIDFFFSESHLYAFVITDTGSDIFSFELNQDLITKCLKDLNFFERPYNLFRIDEVHKQISEWFSSFFKDIANRKDVKKICICSHGILHSLPLINVLTYENFSVNMGKMPSEGELIGWNVPHALLFNPSVGVIGKPDYQYLGVSVSDNPDLNFHEEIMQVSSFFNPDKVHRLTNHTAIKEKIIPEMLHADVIHFACHGHVRTDMSELSYLQLGSGERFSVGDIIAHSRTKAKLVIISACSTSIGRMNSTDEILSLARAFLYIGAQSILATLWPIKDEKAKEFIFGFTQLWVAEKIPLKIAFNRIIRTFIEKYPDNPEIWSSFILLDGFEEIQ
jgi:CHAT domain-containing protein/tetratricopeptide (TPR) repeat protein